VARESGADGRAWVRKGKNDIWVGCLCALGCEIFFGISYIFTKQAIETAGAFELLGWRFFTAFAVMSVCAMLGIVKIHLKGKNVVPLLWVALCCPVMYFIGETIGIDRTSASESGVFLACTPVASLVASSLILKKRPSAMQMLGIGITLAGVLLTVFAANVSVSFSIIGYLFLTLGVVSYSLYSVFVAKADKFNEAEITYMMLVVGAAVFGSIALVQNIIEGGVADWIALPFRNATFLTAILYQGIGCSILAFFLFNMAVARIGVNRSVSFVGGSTVMAIVAGVLVLHETLSSGQLIGAAVIIAGIYIANAGKLGK